jgi:hypothetical protein
MTRQRFLRVGERRRYSEAEDAALLDLAEGGAPMLDIAHHFGRDSRDVLDRFNLLMAELPKPERAAFLATRKAAMERQQRLGSAAPQKAVLDARQRERARATSLNALLFGDPPPGFSARDGRVGMVRV